MARLVIAVAAVSAVHIHVRLETVMEIPLDASPRKSWLLTATPFEGKALPPPADGRGQRPTSVLRKLDQKPGPTGSARLAAAILR